MSRLSVIDFYSEHCSPCKSLAKDLDTITQAVPMDVQKVNIEENFDLVEKYRVRSVPTLVVFKNGEQVGTYTGYKGSADLTAFLTRHAN